METLTSFKRVRKNLIIPEANIILADYIEDASRMPAYSRLMIFPIVKTASITHTILDAQALAQPATKI